MRWFKVYEHYNATMPILTRSFTGISLYFVGDCMAQFVESRIDSRTAADAKEFDAGRAARTCSWRALIHTPIAFTMYNVLDKKLPGTGIRQVASKMAIDLMLVAPPVFGSFLLWCKFLETFDVGKASLHAKDRFRDAMIYSYAFWVPTHVITYGFIPCETLISVLHSNHWHS